MTDGLSTRIRAARDDVGLTREQMAPKIGVTLRTLARWENGETQRISTDSLLAVARVTRKPLAYFLTETTEAVA